MDQDIELSLEPTLRSAAERAAEAEGTSLSDFVNRAVIDRLSFTNPGAYFAARAARAKPGALSTLLDRAPDVPPLPGDELDERSEPS